MMCGVSSVSLVPYEVLGVAPIVVQMAVPVRETVAQQSRACGRQPANQERCPARRPSWRARASGVVYQPTAISAGRVQPSRWQVIDGA